MSCSSRVGWAWPRSAWPSRLFWPNALSTAGSSSSTERASRADLLFSAEYDDWRRSGFELLVTVDRADASWHGNVGVVPILLRRLRIDPERTVLLACGPEIMMRFSVAEALADGLTESADLRLARA